MFYWFKRGAESLRYEARQVSPTQFELTIVYPDGVQRVERFDSADALHQRQVSLEHELIAQGWVVGQNQQGFPN
jgi:hypothetical protein